MGVPEQKISLIWKLCLISKYIGQRGSPFEKKYQEASPSSLSSTAIFLNVPAFWNKMIGGPKTMSGTGGKIVQTPKERRMWDTFYSHSAYIQITVVKC